MDRIYAPWRSRYFTMPKEEGCLFCNIQKEEDDRKAGILARGEHWYVILNTFPYTNGHIMVVSNRHIKNFAGIRGEETGELFEFLKKAEGAVNEAYSPQGINVGVNLGSAAGAGVVDHLHFHIVPRWVGDTNFMTALAETRVVSEELDRTYRNLCGYFE
jgi:ATP adenylyltransferase